MHATTARLADTGTIFSEHEAFEGCCHFYISILFKSVNIMNKLSVLTIQNV